MSLKVYVVDNQLSLCTLSTLPLQLLVLYSAWSDHSYVITNASSVLRAKVHRHFLGESGQSGQGGELRILGSDV